MKACLYWVAARLQVIEGEGLLWEGDVPCIATLLTNADLVRALQDRRFAGPDGSCQPGMDCMKAMTVLRCMHLMSCLFQHMHCCARLLLRTVRLSPQRMPWWRALTIVVCELTQLVAQASCISACP
jgi:hypothetical protein